MKTAEETAIDLFNWIANHLGEKELTVEQCRKAATEKWELLTNFMAETKLDAAKWGAEQAAKIAEQMRVSTVEHYGVAESVGADKAKRAIQHFATSLTINDLPK